MTTLEETLASRNRLSEYHVYHEGMDNVVLTPFIDPAKEWGYNKNNHNRRTEDHIYNQRGSDGSDNYFLHKPTLLFRDPPRTLRRGNRKDGVPISIINKSAFWREWNIQFFSNLEEVIDPRAIVRWQHRSKPDNDTKQNGYALKGCKVRSWRVWGESGGEYHRHVNARRKALCEDGKEEEIHPFDPNFADESVKLKWSFPMSHTRRYSFEYAGMSFWWEGTRDVQPIDAMSAKLMPLNHLKLVAKPAKGESMLVAHYTSGFSSKKFGKLLVFDSAIIRLLEDTCEDGFVMSHVAPDKSSEESPQSNLNDSRLYELVMATAMCMVVGVWEKRMTVWSVVMLIVTIGNGMNVANIRKYLIYTQIQILTRYVPMSLAKYRPFQFWLP